MNKNQKSLTNKGFSLVELIIVIAIMAVLVGVLAPQFMRYVERSRESADIQNCQEIISAIQVAVADPTMTVNAGTISITPTSAAVSGATGGNCSDATLATALTTSGISKLQGRSTAYGTVTITVTINAGVPSFTTDVTALNTALGL